LGNPQFCLILTMFLDQLVGAAHYKILDDVIDTGDEFHLPYSLASGDSFDTYNDCSGFVNDLYELFFNKTLRSPSAGYQYQAWKNEDAFHETTYIPVDVLKPGDLVYFKNPKSKKAYRGATHVVMFIGEGYIIHERNKDTGVEIIKLDDYYTDQYVGYLTNRGIRISKEE
jgi:cell wall-associated NlpC family hydrolase